MRQNTGIESGLLHVYMEAAEMSQNGVMWLNEEGHILFLNSRFARELGYNKEEFSPRTIFEVDPRINLLEWRRLWKELQATNKISIETEHITAEDAVFPVKLQGILFPIGEQSTCITFIQSTRGLQAHGEELEFAQYCLDYSREIIFWFGPDGAITYANVEACRSLGYTREELLAMNKQDLVWPPHPDWQAHWSELKHGKMVEFRTSLRRKDGSTMPVDVFPSYFRFRGKEFSSATVHDLSKRLEQEEKLFLASETLGQTSDMVFWLNRDGTFKYTNPAFCQCSGYSKKELEGLLLLDLFEGFSMEDFEKSWNRIASEGQQQPRELMMTCKDGTKVPAEVSVTIVHHNGKEYSSSVMRDISGRVKKEEDLRLQLQEIDQHRERLEAENLTLKEEIQLGNGFGNIITRSMRYRKLLKQVEQVADTDTTVLILGETGTGKELLARAIHQLSNRSEHPLIKVNCSALPATLIESELFGHEKGAFTGAFQRKIGRFERADGGTIFLDEIGELPLDLQAKLLRVLQEGEFERVGGTESLTINVRVIAATNRNLNLLVGEGKFRSDLFYRLNVFPIHNLPLRERPEDIPLLVEHFVRKFSNKVGKNISIIPRGVMDKLVQYDFPGNVRELENIIERAVILSMPDELSIDTMLFSQAGSSGHFQSLEQAQRQHILEALRRTAGRISGERGAAKLLDINDKTLISRMKKLGITKAEYQNGKISQ